MLEVRRRQSIRGAHCPAVVEQSDIGRADVNHRLNRERHARLQFWSAAAFAVIGDLGFLMHFASNAVPNKFAPNGKTKPRALILILGQETPPARPLLTAPISPAGAVSGACRQLFGASFVVPTGTVVALSPT